MDSIAGNVQLSHGLFGTRGSRGQGTYAGRVGEFTVLCGPGRGESHKPPHTQGCREESLQ